MKQLLLQILIDSTKMITTKTKSGIADNNRFWIAAAGLGIFFFLFIKLGKKKKITFDNTAHDILDNSKNAKVDMSDLMDNINKSKELYKQLSTKCHPDRFIDENQNKIAVELFQEITKNKRNYNKLLELKETATKELDLTI